ncbi:cytochrome P450 monooxygenase pc-1, partial [Mycena olivaceomarginata]
TAGLLTFTIYMLAEHPEILTKLREEILRIVGPTQRPTFDNFRDMKLLTEHPEILTKLREEILRIHSPAPTKTDGRSFVPAGTRCAFSTILMHRRTDLWGPDALQFDPERLLDERLHKYLTPNPFIFLPFNAGPRICLNQRFAYHKSSFFLVRLLQMFSSVSFASNAQPPEGRPPASWKTDDKAGWKAHEKIRPRSHLTMFVFGGMWVRIEEVGAAEGV